MNLEDFLYVCHMKGFMRKIVAFLFAVIFAIIPVERGLCVNVSRFPSSPITGKVGENIAFLYEQQLYCQLVDLWEKVVEDCYDKYKAQLCYDGHYLYSLCKMLI